MDQPTNTANLLWPLCRKAKKEQWKQNA